MAIYMKYGTLEGEVTETVHKGWIAVNSASFGASRSTSVEVGSGQEKRHRDMPNISDVQVSREFDKSSPLMFNESVAGKATHATLHFMKPASKPDGEPLVYLEMKLQNCLITSWSVGGGAAVSESFSLNFTAIDMYYTPYDDKDVAGTQSKGYFNLVTAKCVPWA